MGRSGGLSRELERKIYDRLCSLRDTNRQTETEEWPVSTRRAIQFVQDRDLTLRRLKRPILEKTVEKVLDVMKTEDDESSAADQDAVLVESDPEDLNSSRLMEVKDTNVVNKSITSLWNTANPTTEEEKKSSSQENTKRKDRRSKTSTGAKRLKSTEASREPPTGISLKDVGGLDECITELLEIVAMPIKHPEVYQHTGIQPPRGVLLHGPPGCGKTMLANALAAELGVPFLSLSAPSIVSGMSGESEKKVRDVFEEAKTLAPCLMFIDEIDAVTPKRESAQREMERRIVAQFLTCMDDLSFENTEGKPVLVIGATNRPDSLDSALRRAGRFDREICLTVPNEESRERILRTMAKGLRLSGDFDFRQLAKQTPGYVGADLKALTSAAGVTAIKRIFNELTSSKKDNADADVMLTDQEEVSSIDMDKIDDDDDMHMSVIQRYLNTHPDPLTAEELEPLAIGPQDFVEALTKVQPSSKREGFATVPDITWAEVGALKSIRVELQMAIVQPIKRPELYRSVGITAPSGVLLWGPPGCGKTLLAKAVANESKANFISIRGPELLNKYVGESERAVRQVFARARASSPCVIFFDELDAMVPKRDDSLSEASSRVVNTLLTELDGLNDRASVYVIAATNRPDIIDAAMLRPGRLDKTLLVDLPDAHERVEILKTITKTTPLDTDINLELIGRDERCSNFSGADLAALVREAAVTALRSAVFPDIASNEPEITQHSSNAPIRVTMADFELAFKNIRPSVSDRDRQKYQRLAKRWSSASQGVE
ncbi:AAA family ATPase Rix7 [Schizosaccharomyces cryophilus OY26]|uniref:Peroxisomal ATPase PEX1 n=1 Tax=Schizosaccharomyces cryophilus (strain OY26 / ATCC MYA-4695 / CBS 11777 / NBRC 106824 / NRRL Y48691) TaxID=653667 RepID=S9W8K4_SCHCR|nr:AAA family ATPase Rix7 [Schizosaccharomyces cryophilus OY26]EPY54215.1 AAA family ATPase Rix7 [Schizosaccharomyces cryophilus OY26]